MAGKIMTWQFNRREQGLMGLISLALFFYDIMYLTNRVATPLFIYLGGVDEN